MPRATWGGPKTRGVPRTGAENKNIMQTHTFDISEADAAKRVGVAVDDIRAQRQALTEGEHYQMKGRRMVLSAEGLDSIAEKMAGGAPAAALIPPASPVIDLIVWRTAQHGIRNPRIVEAHPPGADPDTIERHQVVRVAVRKNQNYWRGQTLKGREIGPGLYEHWDVVLQCQANPPRTKGKA